MVLMFAVSVIGVGQWGVNYLRVFRELDDAKVKWCCDTDKGRLEKIKKFFPEVFLTIDYNDILKDKEVSAVCIATPATTHYKIVKECLEAGKDVLVEKPITINSEETVELIKLAEKSGRILMVGHIFLYHPAVEKLKELITKNELGEIYYLYSSRTGLGPIRADVNAMWDLAPHDISIFCYLLGTQPISVNATGVARLRDKIEDVVFLTLRFPNNIIGHIHVSWFDYKKIRKMVTVGSKKMAVFDDTETNEKLKIITATQPDERLHLTYDEFLRAIRYGDIYTPSIDLTEPLKLEISHFMECIKNRKQPKTDGYNGLQVVKILEAAQKSLMKNGALVKINKC
jgi:predicted dehydrogenase